MKFRFCSMVFVIILLGNSSKLTSAKKTYMKVGDMMLKVGMSSAKLRWPKARIPYTIPDGLSDIKIKQIRDAMDLLQQKTCVRFIPKKHARNYVAINDKKSGCYSYVGYVQRGAQDLNLGSGCWSTGVIVHELIHAIGFNHQHERNDRDKFVTIHYENVESGSEHNFNLDKELGMKFDNYGLPYNFGSIMHYGRKYFSKNGGSTVFPKKTSELSKGTFLHLGLDAYKRPIIGNREVLTEGDVKMINRMYNCK